MCLFSTGIQCFKGP